MFELGNSIKLDWAGKNLSSKHEPKKVKKKRVENRQHIIKIYLESH
jgi:hypothetical protein